MGRQVSPATPEPCTAQDGAVDSFGRRLEIVEKRQNDNMPRLDAQIQDNRLQDQRLQNMVEAAADERRARQESDEEERKSRAEILAMISKLADKVADLDKAVAVMNAPAHRSSLSVPEHEAQAAPNH